MTAYSLHLPTPVPNTFRVHQIAGLFDLPLDKLESRLTHSLTVEPPGLDEDWTIGAIVGPSGSGKTTLARAVYGDALYQPQPWPADDAIIDCLGEGPIKSLTRVLTAVGLGSVPTWLKRYRLLSTGEQFGPISRGRCWPRASGMRQLPGHALAHWSAAWQQNITGRLTPRAYQGVRCS